MVRRGFDRVEVEAFQQQVVDHIEALRGRIREIEQRISQVGITDLTDLKREFEIVGEDVQEILQSARDAAEDMRDRAGADAARWRDEAAADAAGRHQEGQRQAETLRRSAWETSESMLTQAVAHAAEMTAKANEDVLFVRAEAEREALRLTGDAKRDAEELLRSARAESEKKTGDARNECESMVAAAQHSVDVAEARVRTLEQRRAELLDELEVTREALVDLEDHIAGRRSALTHATTDPTETSVRVLSDDKDSADPSPEDWLDEDATVRLLPPPLPGGLERVDADELAAEVESLRSVSPPIVPIEPPRHGLELVTGGSESSAEAASLDFEITSGELPAAADVSATAELIAVGEKDSEPEPGEPEVQDLFPEEPEPAVAPGPASDEAEPDEPEPAAQPADDIDSLFASLRAPQPEAQPAPTPEAEPAPAPAEQPAPQPEPESEPQPKAEPATGPEPPGPADLPTEPPRLGAVDPWALRDRLLIPVTNEVLRGIKRSIVEAQNAVLEGLRTGAADWRPKKAMFDGVVGVEAQAIAAGSYLAGVAAAGELAGAAAPDLPDGSTRDLSSVVTDLWEAAVDAIEGSSEGGSRERGASVGRVFRAWRTDEAERRVRRVAHSEYNAGVVAGLAALGVAHSVEPPGRDPADPDAAVIPAF